MIVLHSFATQLIVSEHQTCVKLCAMHWKFNSFKNLSEALVYYECNVNWIDNTFIKNYNFLTIFLKPKVSPKLIMKYICLQKYDMI